MSVLARFKELFYMNKDPKMKNLREEEWRTMLQASDRAVIIDVRTPAEWGDGIIPGAILSNIMDGPEFTERMMTWEKEKEYFVYCRSGNRSGQACRFMAQHGFTSYNLEGGIMAWQGEVKEAVS